MFRDHRIVHEESQSCWTWRRRLEGTLSGNVQRQSYVSQVLSSRSGGLALVDTSIAALLGIPLATCEICGAPLSVLMKGEGLVDVIGPGVQGASPGVGKCHVGKQLGVPIHAASQARGEI